MRPPREAPAPRGPRDRDGSGRALGWVDPRAPCDRCLSGARANATRAGVQNGPAVGYRESHADRGMRPGLSFGAPSGGLRWNNQDADNDGRREDAAWHLDPDRLAGLHH